MWSYAYAQRLRGIRAYTLIEMMIVILIMGILGAASLGMMAAIFNSSIQGTEMYQQSSDIDTMTDFMRSELESVQVGEVGLTANGGTTLNPTSLAGDQVIFQHGSHCYRVFYLARTEELRASISESGCSPITPARGPNEAVSGGGYTLSDPSDPLYDPILDLQGSSVLLAENVVLDANGGTNTTQHSLFSFLYSSGAPLPTDSQAYSGSMNSIYTNTAPFGQIMAVQINGFVAGPSGAGVGINARAFQQTFYLNQV